MKKPFYKKWWFWLIVVIVVVGVAGGSGEEQDNASQENTPKQEQKQEANKTELKSEYKVGETAEHNGLKMTVKEVKWLPANEYSNLKDGQQYCVVKVELQNNGSVDHDYNPFDFKLNDNGNKTDMMETPFDEAGEYKQYTDNMLESGTLAKGAKVEGYLIGGANPNDNVKLEYTGNMFDSNSKVTFNLK